MPHNRVIVERCFGSKVYLRLTFPGGARERIEAEEWSRKVASEALDLAEHVYHMNRRSVRFVHR